MTCTTKKIKNLAQLADKQHQRLDGTGYRMPAIKPEAYNIGSAPWRVERTIRRAAEELLTEEALAFLTALSERRLAADVEAVLHAASMSSNGNWHDSEVAARAVKRHAAPQTTTMTATDDVEQSITDHVHLVAVADLMAAGPSV